MAAFTKLSHKVLLFHFYRLVCAHESQMTWTIIFCYKFRSQN